MLFDLRGSGSATRGCAVLLLWVPENEAFPRPILPNEIATIVDTESGLAVGEGKGVSERKITGLGLR